MVLHVFAIFVLALQFVDGARALVTPPAPRPSIADCRVTTKDASGSIDVGVLCPRGVRYRVLLLGSPQCGVPRTMSGVKGQRPIHYFLLTPNRSGIWCDGTNGTQLISATGNGGTQHYTALPRILEEPGRARLPSGGYADTVTVFLERP